MGQSIQVECKCGYCSPVLMGGGGSPDGALRAVMNCPHCMDIVGVNAKAKRPRCPKCKRTVKPLFRDCIEWVKMDYDLKFKCPVCGEFPIEIKGVALWD